MGAPVPDHLWKCREFRWVIYHDPGYLRDVEYAVVQKTNKPVWCTPAEFKRVLAYHQSLIRDKRYTVVWEDPQLVVFGKTTR